jgi:hypothetical protein
MCQPLPVSRFGEAPPPTLVAVPLVNGTPCVITSQKPQ